MEMEMEITNPRRERKTTINDDIWREIIAEEQENRNRNNVSDQQTQCQPKIAVTYQRLKPPDVAPSSKHSHKAGSSNSRSSRRSSNDSRMSFVPPNPQRISWNRSLSTRGRISIAVLSVADKQERQQQAKPRRKPKPPLPKGKVTQLPNFEKERAYFQEVDADELLVESPSPKKFAWVMGNRTDSAIVPPLCTRLEKWLNDRRQYLFGSHSLSTILRTPRDPLEPIPYDDTGFESSYMGKTEELCLRSTPALGSVQGVHTELQKTDKGQSLENKDFDDIESEIRKLSLTQRPGSFGNDPFLALLKECGQSGPLTLLQVFSKLCDPGSIVKIGEGTYGEAFIAGGSVCKIVPVDGELRVNGEMQKRSVELLEEVILSLALNHLRGTEEALIENATTTFIQTKDIRVCQGPYDPALVRAWESWDMEHGSENDHPKQFPENQCYVVSILEHGGTDLESFVLLDFTEAQSLLVQVTAALAVAEAAFQFEHRDLHWGNILLSRKDTCLLPFTLEGKTMSIKTQGLLVSIIDFTLSRINTGNTILYLDLSSDPELFEGPKGDKQSETYRKMREVTEDCWDGSFPKTNVLWLQYLVDILLLKKSFKRSGKDERELRSLKKRMNSYDSAKEALSDPFFNALLEHAT